MLAPSFSDIMRTKIAVKGNAMAALRETVEQILSAIPPLNIAVRGIKIEHDNSKFANDFSVLPPEDERLLKEVLTKGYAVLPGYFDEKWCNACREAVDKTIDKHPEYVRIREDERLFGSDKICPELKQFHDEPRFQRIADAYVGEKSVVSVSMANRLGRVPGANLGSGGDWHRDRMIRQIKSIVYLEDVGPNDGPFQYIEGSNTYNAENFRKDSRITGLPHPATRFTAADIKKLTDRQAERLITFTEKKGTVILADTSGLHRGSPLGEGGSRYAVFNYYLEESKTDWAFIEKKFGPILPEGFTI